MIEIQIIGDEKHFLFLCEYAYVFVEAGDGSETEGLFAPPKESKTPKTAARRKNTATPPHKSHKQGGNRRALFFQGRVKVKQDRPHVM